MQDDALNGDTGSAYVTAEHWNMAQTVYSTSSQGRFKKQNIHDGFVFAVMSAQLLLPDGVSQEPETREPSGRYISR